MVSCRRSAFLALLVAGTVWGSATGAPPESPPAPLPPIVYGPSRQVATLANPEVNESSGLACSRRVAGVFWTHNDSGDTPRVFAFNAKGEHLATVTLAGAQAWDWEDMASFEAGGKPYLVIADIGDNLASRKTCTLYVVAEPAVGTREQPRVGQVPVSHRIDFTYEGGPRDCEALAIDPTTGAMVLVSKEGIRCRVYALQPPRGKAAPGAPPPVARQIGEIETSPAVAMDISPDGRRAVVLTYADALEFARGPKETWTDAFARPPRALVMPRRRQGETICYGPDGKTLYLTSERTPTPLLEVPVAEAKAPGGP